MTHSESNPISLEPMTHSESNPISLEPMTDSSLKNRVKELEFAVKELESIVEELIIWKGYIVKANTLVEKEQSHRKSVRRFKKYCKSIEEISKVLNKKEVK